METKVTTYRKKIILYYSHKGESIRVSTGFKEKSKLSLEDTKELVTLKQKYDDIIRDYIKEYGEKPTCKWIKDQLDKPKLLKTKEILPMLKQVIEIKREIIRPESMKDWMNLLIAIENYEEYTKQTLYVADIDLTFFEKFQQFLSIVRNPTTKDKRKRGGLNSNTIRKRIKTFCAFLKAINLKFPKFDKNSGLTKARPTTFVTVKPEEITQLLDLELTGMKEKVRDIFVFGCMTGLRYSDIITLTKHHIVNNKIHKFAVKTDMEFTVPLNRTASRILQKYDYDLNIYVNQVFNREIKEIMKLIPSFHTVIVEKVMSLNKDRSVEQPRWKMVESHTMRRTFINAQINKGTPLPIIMKMTSHHTVEMLLVYADKDPDVDQKYADNIDV